MTEWLYKESKVLMVEWIDIIHDTCHLCMHLRTDEIKAISRGFSQANKLKKLPMQEIKVEFVYPRQQAMTTLSS